MSANNDANKTVSDLKKLYAHNMLAEDRIVDALQRAERAMRARGALLVEKHNVRFSGQMEDGKRVTSVAEIVFGRFGQGEDAKWVAFCVYDGGFTNVYRVFSKDTANMAWLEAYIKSDEELAG